MIQIERSDSARFIRQGAGKKDRNWDEQGRRQAWKKHRKIREGNKNGEGPGKNKYGTREDQTHELHHATNLPNLD